MKITCSDCKTTLGEQTPFDDPFKIYARCVSCLAKQKEKASRFTPEPKPGQKKEITLENGMKGVLWVPESKEEKLSLGELAVSGKRCFCSKYERVKCQNYLAGLKDEDVDVSFLHSMTCKIETSSKSRKKKQDPPKIEEPKKDDSINYNCTIRAPKHYVQLIFDDMAERMDRVLEILAEASLKACKEDRQKANTNDALSPMSGSKELGNPIS